MITTVTSKGQVTIPIFIRKSLKLKPKDKVAFFLKNGEVTLKSAVDFFSLRGSIKTEKRFNIKQMEEQAQKLVVGEYRAENTQ